MRRILGVVIAVTLLVAAPARADGRSLTHGPERSRNWSGYAVGADSDDVITAVRGTWVVPSIKAAPPGFSSSWIGIGGYRTSDLIQIGTASSGVIDGNYAWFELLPGNAIEISDCEGDVTCEVRSGDRMTGSVLNIGGDLWRLELVNRGRGGRMFVWEWSTTVSYASSRSSAEWIFEAPTIGLPGAPLPGMQTTPAHTAKAKFYGGDYTINGVTKRVESGGAQRIVMVTPCRGTPISCANLATPSMLGSDGRFAVCTYKQRCPNFV